MLKFILSALHGLWVDNHPWGGILHAAGVKKYLHP